MLLINLYGAPGAGKSTGAAYIFAKLKMAGINAELVTEFAKDKVWEESKAVFDNQAYIFGKQYFRISRVQDKVDVIVTDSPLLLSCYYGKDDPRLGEEFNALVEKVAASYTSLNAFIKRVKPYNSVGRFQTEDESDGIMSELYQFLDQHKVNVKTYSGDIAGYNTVVDDALTLLKQQNAY